MLSIRMSFKTMSPAVLAFLLMSLPNATLAADTRYGQTFSDKSATGEELANAFFDLLSNTGSPTGTVGTTPEQDEASKALVKPYLDPAFLLQRASGERYTAETYLPADVDEFEIGDVTETRAADDVLVAHAVIPHSSSNPNSSRGHPRGARGHRCVSSDRRYAASLPHSRQESRQSKPRALVYHPSRTCSP